MEKNTIQKMLLEDGCGENSSFSLLLRPINSLEKAYVFKILLRGISFVKDLTDDLFEVALFMLNEEEITKIVMDLQIWLGKNGSDKDAISNSASLTGREALRNFPNLGVTRSLMRELFISTLEETNKLLNSFSCDDGLAERLSFLQSSLELTDDEINVLLVLNYNEDNDFVIRVGKAIKESLGFDIWSDKGFSEMVSVFSRVKFKKVQSCLAEQGGLSQYGLLEDKNTLKNIVKEFIGGIAGQDLGSLFYNQFEGTSLPFSESLVSNETKNTVEMLWRSRKLRRCTSILLYGVPGTGKTEFVRSFAQHINADLYEIIGDESDTYSKRSELLRTSFYAATKSIINKNAIIVMDEIDELLSTEGQFGYIGRGKDKGDVNLLLESSTLFSFWITNDVDKIHPSVMRRFNYSIKFNSFTKQQRLQIWKKSADRIGVTHVIGVDEITSCAERYDINAGGISMALDTIKTVAGNIEYKKNITSHLHELLQAHSTAIGNDRNHKKRSLPIEYDPSVINIEGGYERVVTILENSCGSTNEWDFENPAPKLLLYGVAGSGKTEFSRYLAKVMNREIIVSRASDLIDKYIGSTEKNIRNLFNSAIEDGSVVCIDEADTFLGSRENAIRSWEISLVNEMLSAIEEFPGVVIFTTNFRENMDNAVMRRFDLKLEIGCLKSSGVETLYEKMFKIILDSRLTVEQVDRLKLMKLLTPGDFAVVRRQFTYYENECTHDTILKALENEQRFKGTTGRTVGF